MSYFVVQKYRRRSSCHRSHNATPWKCPKTLSKPLSIMSVWVSTLNMTLWPFNLMTLWPLTSSQHVSFLCRLFRDVGRTYVQWVGEAEARRASEGRLVLVSLICRDAAQPSTPVFRPCLAFRVAGSPGVYKNLLFRLSQPLPALTISLSISYSLSLPPHFDHSISLPWSFSSTSPTQYQWWTDTFYWL